MVTLRIWKPLSRNAIELDNHRPIVWNVGDIFDNDNRITTAKWAKRRIPLGAYFTLLLEKQGFHFVDDFIWDKGEVQSQRHKNGDKPYRCINTQLTVMSIS